MTPFQRRPAPPRARPAVPAVTGGARSPAPSPRPPSAAPPATGRAIATKIVGSTFTPVGQKALRLMRERGEDAFRLPDPQFRLVLREEPHNVHDRDAILILVYSHRTQNEVTLGHVSNSERRCAACGAEYEKPERGTAAPKFCPACGGPLERHGLASRLVREAHAAGLTVTDFWRAEVAWAQGGVTGSEDTNFGCNLRLVRQGDPAP